MRARVVGGASLAAIASAGNLHCRFDSEAAYSCTGGSTVAVFKSAPVAVYVGGKWYSSSGAGALGHLSLTARNDSAHGSDEIGDWHGYSREWDAGGTAVVTSIKNYGDAAVFKTAWPKGADETSNTREAYHGVSVNFPAFASAASKQVLSWGGSFMPPQIQTAQDVFEKGEHSGLPAVFFDDAATSPMFIMSALDHFFAASTDSTLADGSMGWAAGTSGTLLSHAPGFAHSFVLSAGSGTGGLNNHLHEFGQLVQRAVSIKPKIPDLTLQKIGYQVCWGVELRSGWEG